MQLDLAGDRPCLDHTDAALQLTDAQRAAMAHDRELAVTAGAGAGKTHTLALRYVSLLLERAVDAALDRERPDVRSVVVLTFTEKAAEEMAARCYRRLLELAASVRGVRGRLDAKWGTGFGNRLVASVEVLVDHFDQAAISTFHSFCARLLRELPAETGTPPGFEVLLPVDAEPLYAQAIDDALRSLLDSDTALAPLLDAFGSHARLWQATRRALGERTLLRHTLAAHAAGDVSLDDLLARAEISPEQVGAWLTDVGGPTLRAVAGLTAPGRGALGPRLRAALDQLPPADDPLVRYGAYREVLEVLLTHSGELRDLSHFTVLGLKAEWPDPRRYAQAKAALQVVAGRCTDWPARFEVARRLPSELDRALLEVLGPFAALVRDAAGRLTEAFDARGAVDFAELQHRAVDAVLTHPEVRARLQRQVRYLMVDEFQDTDAVQWSLIRAIGRPPDAAHDRIFVVGDPKQAIYGFRGGDVTVFQAALHELGEPVVLGHNFRSRPTLITWFNQLFPAVLRRRPEAPWEVAYDPIQAGRDAGPGTVQIVVDEPGDTPWEPQAVATLVADELLSEHAERYDDRERWPTPPIAVLLRARTHLTAYEDALRARGVPYVVGRGVGFWARPEVIDVVNAVHAVATRDPLSVVGWLRSPMLGLSDQNVHDLVSGPDWADFGERDIPDAPPVIRRAAALFGRALALRHRLPLTALLHDLLDQSGAWAVWQHAADQGQATANAVRLLEMVAQLEPRQGLDEVASFLLEQVQTAQPESEATLGPSAARVVLLTIHAAKGLEFPVVLVPELGAAQRHRPDALTIGRLAPNADGSRPWQLAFPVLDPDAPVQRRERPGLLHRLHDVQRAEADAEYRRLLYVACTRARDHLVLLGTERDNTWMSAVLAHPGDAEVRRWAGTPEPEAVAPPAQAPPPSSSPAPAPSAPAPSIEVAPSSLDAFVADPARWVRTAVLGIPEVADAGGADLHRRVAGLRGDVLHSLLEDDCADDNDVALARWQVAARNAGLNEGLVARGWATLQRHLGVVAHDPVVRAVLDAPGRAEVDFRLEHGRVVLHGQIDRLYQSDGHWVVLDYKSERVGTADTAELARRHRSQLLAYVWAADQVLRAHGQPPVRTAQIYFSEVGVLETLAFTDADLTSFEALLVRVAEVAAAPWTVTAGSPPGEPGPPASEATPTAADGHW